MVVVGKVKRQFPLMSRYKAKRALWLQIEEWPGLEHKMSHWVDKIAFPLCTLTTHEGDACALNPLDAYHNGILRRCLLCYCMWTKGMEFQRHVLPYEYPVRATVLHVDTLNKVLFVRSQDMDRVNALLQQDMHRFNANPSALHPVHRVSIAKVYLVYRREANGFARAVCAAMRYEFHSVKHWQMYLIDLGLTEFINEQNVVALPDELMAYPPVAVPLALSDCVSNLNASSSCKNPHFDHLTTGSACIFMVSSTWHGQMMPACGGAQFGGNLDQHVFPPVVYSRLFYASPTRNEVLCRPNGGMSVEALRVEQEHSYTPLTPCSFQFKRPSLHMPVRVCARVTAKVGTNVYWLRMDSICDSIDNSIVAPSQAQTAKMNCASPTACLVSAVLPMARKSNLCRAIAVVDLDRTEQCSAFLIDYGLSVTCSTCDVYDLSLQPPAVIDTPSAAFRCQINGVMLDGSAMKGPVKLAVDEEYVIDVLSVDSSWLYSARVQLSHPQNAALIRCALRDRAPATVAYSPSTPPPSLCPNQPNKTLLTCAPSQPQQYTQPWESAIRLLSESNQRTSDEVHRISLKLDLFMESYHSAQANNRTVPTVSCLPIAPAYVVLNAARNAAVFVDHNNVVLNQLVSMRTYLGGGRHAAREQVVTGRGDGSADQGECLPVPLSPSTRTDLIHSNITDTACPSHQHSVLGNSCSSSEAAWSQLSSSSCGSEGNARLSLSDQCAECTCARGVSSTGVATDGGQTQTCACHEVTSPRTVATNTDSTREEHDNTLHAEDLAQGEGMANTSEQAAPINAVAITNAQQLNSTTSHTGVCWMCGEQSTSKYCVQTPTPLELTCLRSMLRNENNKLINKSSDSSRSVNNNNKQREVLYTSDESSDEDGDSNGSLSYAPCSSTTEDNSLFSSNTSGALEEWDALPSAKWREVSCISLKYRPWLRCVEVKEGRSYRVERSDDEYACWPLFFVCISNSTRPLCSKTHCHPLASQHVKVGQLCVAFCERSNSKCRAVITAIQALVEVLFVDVGFYEWVAHSSLWALDEEDAESRTRPAMAIPCVLSEYGVSVQADRQLSTQQEQHLKQLVSHPNNSFNVRFMAQSNDSVFIVRLSER